MNLNFYTTKPGDDHIAGSYKQGECFFNAWLEWPQDLRNGIERELIVHLTNVVGTITILDILAIAKHCRDQMLPAWYAGRPGWARVLVNGRVWADALFLGRGPSVYGLTEAEATEIRRLGYYNPRFEDKVDEMFGVSRILRAEDEEGRVYQALKRPGEPIASLDWDPV